MPFFRKKQVCLSKYKKNMKNDIKNLPEKGCCTLPFGIYGSLTIEAALGLTLFMFTIICLSMPLKMLDTHRKVQMTLEAVSRELSKQAYLQYRITQGECMNSKENTGELLSLFTNISLISYLNQQIKAAVGDNRIEKLDLSKTRVSEDGEMIDLWVEYRLKLPFSIFQLESIPAEGRSLRRGWIGSKGGRLELKNAENEEKERTVYVGKNRGRFHWSKSCHYISNDIHSVSSGDLGNKTNSSGNKYKPCSICGRGTDLEIAYILPNGRYYHSRKDCSSISYYVRETILSEVEYLGECSYCKRMKGGA